MSSLPTATDLEKLDYSYQGQPFCDVPAKASIDTTTMDYSYQGQPFVTNPAPSAPATGNSNFLMFFE